MIDHGRHFQIKNLEESIAVVLTVIMMPLTFSITAGAVFGILSFVIMKILLGKYRELSPVLLFIALVCCAWFSIY